jgi:hypothetical protein
MWTLDDRPAALARAAEAQTIEASLFSSTSGRPRTVKRGVQASGTSALI